MEAPERGLETTPGAKRAGASPGGPSPKAGPFLKGDTQTVRMSLSQRGPAPDGMPWAGIPWVVQDPGDWTLGKVSSDGGVWVILEKQGRHSNSIPQVGHYIQVIF